MKFKWMAKLAAVAFAAFLAVSAVSVFADGEKQLTVHFEDVTATDATTQYGEAKIKVSLSGVSGKASVIQNAFTFDGLEYKSVRFLKGENDPPKGFWYAPTDLAAVNADKKFTLGIASGTGIDFADDEEVFIVTFAGEPGETVTLKVADDLENTYAVIDGQKIAVTAAESGTASASEKGNKSIEAVVKLVMDKVIGFNGEGDTGLTLRITSEDTEGYVITNPLSNKPVQENGHRESTDIPTFTIKNSVLGGDKYTVELFGAGYVPYKKTGVSFAEPLEITNAEFVPGDVNGDGVVDATDKKAAEESQKGEFNEAADFDRNGKTDAADLAVFDGLDEEKKVPAKMEAPTVTGGAKKITVKWTKPDDDTVTGYTVQYGTTKTKLSGKKEITSADTLSVEVSNLSEGTTYYVQIAAKNETGTGEFSDIVSAKTQAAQTGGGGTGGGGTGGGGTGGGGTGGGSTGGGSTGGSTGGNKGGSTGGSTTTPTDPTPTEPTKPAYEETFTDLDGHPWAKDSIYALKNKGIINGISETEFAPASNIKRGDFILILTRMLSINNEFTDNFDDVPVGSYYYNAIGSARVAGIAKGSGTSFMPEESITRQDLITLAYRAFLGSGYLTESEDLTPLDAFGDKGEIADYAAVAMASMVKAGIIQGSDGNVNPNGNATRAEVAVMCARLAALMN